MQSCAPFFLYFLVMNEHFKEHVEYACAVLCVFAAIAVGVGAMMLQDEHDIHSGVLIYIAQLLVFAASVFHLNYKLLNYGETKNDK